MNQSRYKSEIEITYDSQTPSEVLDKLADTTHSFYIKVKIIQHPNTALKTLYKILDSTSEDLNLVYDLNAHYNLKWCVFHIQLHSRATEELIIKCRSQLLKFQLKNDATFL
jgi:hypothetical protein